jgi:hypothetical protein
VSLVKEFKPQEAEVPISVKGAGAEAASSSLPLSSSKLNENDDDDKDIVVLDEKKEMMDELNRSVENPIYSSKSDDADEEASLGLCLTL